MYTQKMIGLAEAQKAVDAILAEARKDPDNKPIAVCAQLVIWIVTASQVNDHGSAISNRHVGVTRRQRLGNHDDDFIVAKYIVAVNAIDFLSRRSVRVPSFGSQANEFRCRD